MRQHLRRRRGVRKVGEVVSAVATAVEYAADDAGNEGDADAGDDEDGIENAVPRRAVLAPETAALTGRNRSVVVDVVEGVRERAQDLTSARRATAARFHLDSCSLR